MTKTSLTTNSQSKSKSPQKTMTSAITAPLFKKRSFTRLVKNIMFDEVTKLQTDQGRFRGNEPHRLERKAVEALMESAEHYLNEVMWKANKCREHAKRKKLCATDVRLAQQLTTMKNCLDQNDYYDDNENTTPTSQCNVNVNVTNKKRKSQPPQRKTVKVTEHQWQYRMEGDDDNNASAKRTLDESDEITSLSNAKWQNYDADQNNLIQSYYERWKGLTSDERKQQSGTNAFGEVNGDRQTNANGYRYAIFFSHKGDDLDHEMDDTHFPHFQENTSIKSRRRIRCIVANE